MSPSSGALTATEHRWLHNELDKWRVPVDFNAIARRAADFFAPLVEVVQTRDLSGRKKGNALIILARLCGLKPCIDRLPEIARLVAAQVAADDVDVRSAAVVALCLLMLHQTSLPECPSVLTPDDFRELLTVAASKGVSNQTREVIASILGGTDRI